MYCQILTILSKELVVQNLTYMQPAASPHSKAALTNDSSLFDDQLLPVFDNKLLF